MTESSQCLRTDLGKIDKVIMWTRFRENENDVIPSLPANKGSGCGGCCCPPPKKLILDQYLVI